MKHLLIKSLLVLGMVLVSACAKEYKTEVDSEFVPYLTKIQNKLDSRSRDYGLFTYSSSVVFAELPRGLDGMCSWDKGKFTVKISRDHWNIAKENYREFLLLHELRHCTFSDSRHDDSLMDIGGHSAPKSIRYSSTILVVLFIDRLGTEDQEIMKNYYYDEMLNPQTEKPNLTK